jgi:hypothetical protein
MSSADDPGTGGVSGGVAGFAHIARMAAARGTRLATLVSAFAFAFSGVSFYETVLKQPNISIFVPPVLQYARDEGEIELFSVPLTITNDGARTGTVLTVDLTVEVPAQGGQPARTKSYYSAYFGEHDRNADAVKRAFAPISIAGRASASETIRFYPRGDVLPRLIDEGGGPVQMRLQVRMARPANQPLLDRWMAPLDPQPLTFTMVVPEFSLQLVGDRRMTVPVHALDWMPTASGGR